MARPLLALVLTLGSPMLPASGAEQDLERIEEACQTVRRQLPQTCACFAEMAANELDDGQQSLLAAWLEDDLEEAATLLRDEVSFEAASAVARFESSRLVFCSQFS